MVEEHELQKEKIQEDYNDKYWEQRYTVVQRHIPSFLQKMAGKVLSTGERVLGVTELSAAPAQYCLLAVRHRPSRALWASDQDLVSPWAWRPLEGSGRGTPSARSLLSGGPRGNRLPGLLGPGGQRLDTPLSCLKWPSVQKKHHWTLAYSSHIPWLEVCS